MKQGLYWKLAWHGIYKNKKIYLPFLLTSIGITMMYYIVSYLTYSKAVYMIRGGQEMQMILSWGTIVTAIFAAIFLFYMNSFLMRLFHQIYRGGCTNEQLYQKISDTLTMLATGGEQA